MENPDSEPESDSFAGLSPIRTSTLPVAGSPRVTTTAGNDVLFYTLPKALLPASWKGTDAMLRFGMSLVTPEQEETAAGAAGVTQNFQAVFREMLIACVVQIGDTDTSRRRQDVISWLAAIGPACRKLVEAAFNSRTSVSEVDTRTFLASAVK